MKAVDIVQIIEDLFNTKDLRLFKDESGLIINHHKEIKTIGYGVALTPDLINEAIHNNVDLIITHHDVFDDLLEMKAYCYDLLRKHGISYYYNHLPLDDADFGTNDALLKGLNLKMIEKTHEWEGLYFGRVGQGKKTSLSHLKQQLEKLLNESVKVYGFNDQQVEKVGVLCGNGAPPVCLKTSADLGCDTYITGECNLYTLQYAKFRKMNVIITSHIFSEKLGMNNFMGLVTEKLKGIHVVELHEEHIETNILKD